MGYQALLFCGDENTARLVTQVLNELDFSVEPAHEPFAAVKRLTTQHFDAVVVDCENEQNAALLFKSARNSGPNRTSLAVAVVEGQPGIAKAFRIGANLVLTKPINVEQSKGTLRVARGLLKKSDAAKTAAAAPQTPSATPKPAPANPAFARPLMPTPQTLKPVPPRAMTTPPPQVVRAEAPSTLELEAEPTPLTEAVDAALLEAMPAPVTPVAPKSGVPKSPWLPTSGTNPFLTGSNEGAAAAPAREITPRRPEAPILRTAVEPLQPLTHEVQVPPPNLGAHAKTSGGSQKWIFAAVLVLLLAAGGYFGWTKFSKHAAPSASNTPAQSAPLQEVAATPSPSAPAVTAPAKAQPQSVAPSQNVETDSSAEESTTESSARKAAPSKAANAEKPSREALVVKNSPSSKAAVPDISAQAIPVVGIAANPGDRALAGIMQSAPNARTPVLRTMKISQGVSQGLVVKKVSPDYPAQARQLRIEGTVQLEAAIGKDGSVTNLKVLGGHPILARAAVDAVRQWKYRPYLLNGQPVEIETQISVNFKLP